jgi:DNA polymerase-1
VRTVVVDIEADGYTPTRIWCIVTRDINSSTYGIFLEGEPSNFAINFTGTFDTFRAYADTVDKWVAHNGISYDIPVINRLLNMSIPYESVIDTFVVSRTINYSGYATHGLEEIGASLGELKMAFSDFSQLTAKMITYCKQDVTVNLKIYNKYKKYINDPSWAKSLWCEHTLAVICSDMHNNGFEFDVEKAKDLLSSVTERMVIIESEFQTLWKPELREVNRLKYRMTVEGVLFKTVENAMNSYPKTSVEGGELVCYDYKTFNPGSPKDRVEKLWAAGWSPTEKTKKHFKFSTQAQVGELWGKSRLTSAGYKEKKETFAYYGWTVGEENLLTLPENAPEGARRLAEWLTLEGRRSSLTEWLGCVREDGRIHGKFWNIGAWTGRMSHSSPNSANIASPFHGKVDSAVAEVKNEYDAQLRACWRVPDGSYLVGTDAEGVQLRILAHYLRSDDYVKAITEGSKELKTDIHNLNLRALALNHLNRDDAKTFIYAFLLGGGVPRLSRILRSNTNVGKGAIKSFVDSTVGLSELKKGEIKRDARRGFFVGLDGRKVACNSEHLMLAGYLQNGESVVMKHANIRWRETVKPTLIQLKQVNFVHDEWQTEVCGSMAEAEEVGRHQREALEWAGVEFGVYCPLAGSTEIGRNWYETH